MGSMQVLDAQPNHVMQVAAIYDAEVDGSPSTFDLERPPIESWQRAVDDADRDLGHLLLVAVEDDIVLGFAKSGRFRDRAAYDSTCETSLYVSAEARGRGVGRALYAELLSCLERSSMLVAVAVMTEPNPVSERLHESLGFERVGTLTGVGIKFGRAWDVTYFQRSLSVPSPAASRASSSSW